MRKKVSTPGRSRCGALPVMKEQVRGVTTSLMMMDVSDMTEKSKIFHQTYTYIKKTVRNFDAVPLLVRIVLRGQTIDLQPA